MVFSLSPEFFGSFNLISDRNDREGFDTLVDILQSFAEPMVVRIGFEATAHYALNLELFLENALLTFMEVNPALISKYRESLSLRKTKTDPIDCEIIARWLMTVDYKLHPKGFYHSYSLKSLTRLRDRLVRQRSLYLVKLINDVHPHFMTIPGIGPLSAAVIYAEFGDISNFSSPAKMLAFAGLEPKINDSGTENHGGRMVKHRSTTIQL